MPESLVLAKGLREIFGLVAQAAFAKPFSPVRVEGDGTYEAVARHTGLDRRTVKKHVTQGPPLNC